MSPTPIEQFAQDLLALLDSRHPPVVLLPETPMIPKPPTPPAYTFPVLSAQGVAAPRRVILESPFAGQGATSQDIEHNQAYARKAMLDSLRRGEAPMLSHLLYTQVLDDTVPEDRQLGIAAGLAWGTVAEATVVYADRGISSGMVQGIRRAQEEGRPVEVRFLQGR